MRYAGRESRTPKIRYTNININMNMNMNISINTNVNTNININIETRIKRKRDPPWLCTRPGGAYPEHPQHGSQHLRRADTTS